MERLPIGDEIQFVANCPLLPRYGFKKTDRRTEGEVPVRYRPLLERVLAGGSADTCPVAFWQHHPLADQQASTLVEATLRFQQTYDCDLVKITPASTFQLIDYGFTDTWRGDYLGRRAVGPRMINSPDDWDRLPDLDPESGFVGQHVMCARQVRHQLDDAVPVLQTVFNPVFQAAALGGDLFTTHLRDHPEAVQRGIDIITAHTVTLIEALVDARVDGIYLVAQHARAGAICPADYGRVALDADRACLQAAGALPLNFMHLHGEHVHAELAGSLPVRVLHYATHADNSTAESLLHRGRHGVSTGPGQEGLIRSGSEQEAADETEEVLGRLKGPRFVLGAGCVLALDTPERNIHAAIAAARTARPDRADA